METSQPSIQPVSKVSYLAIASLITAPISIVILPFALPLTIIFGHMAMSRIKKSSGKVTGFGMALAGTILGYVGVVWCIASIIMIINRATVSTEESDRHGCFMNSRNVQQAVRLHANIKNLQEGDPIDWNVILGPDGYMPKPVCRLGGTYTFTNTIPPIGTVICKCSHANHVPEDHHNW